MDAVFKALADKSRRSLLDRLAGHSGLTLVQLCARLPMSRQGVMKHLAILEDANLVVVRRVGREKLHYLNPVPLQETYGRWIAKYQESQLVALDALKTGLEAPKRRKSR